jgi:hypothetical protein
MRTIELLESFVLHDNGWVRSRQGLSADRRRRTAYRNLSARFGRDERIRRHVIAHGGTAQGARCSAPERNKLLNPL